MEYSSDNELIQRLINSLWVEVFFIAFAIFLVLCGFIVYITYFKNYGFWNKHSYLKVKSSGKIWKYTFKVIEDKDWVSIKCLKDDADNNSNDLYYIINFSKWLMLKELEWFLDSDFNNTDIVYIESNQWYTSILVQWYQEYLHSVIYGNYWFLWFSEDDIEYIPDDWVEELNYFTSEFNSL